MNKNLYIYTIFSKPKDFPTIPFVCRRFIIGPGEVTAEESVYMVGAELDPIRERLANLGLVCINRDPNDDPVIVESWI